MKRLVDEVVFWIAVAMVAFAVVMGCLYYQQLADECHEKGGLFMHGACFDVKVLIP